MASQYEIESQRIRHEMYEPDRIAENLRHARDHGDAHYAAAIGMIRGSEYFGMPASDRLQMIQRILDALDRVVEEHLAVVRAEL